MASNGYGITLIQPSSVDFTGSSATINDAGGVSYTSITVLSLNGVFSSDFERYYILAYMTDAGTNNAFRLRAGGTDDTSSNYNIQETFASTTLVDGSRVSSTTSWNKLIAADASYPSDQEVFIFGPAAATPTVARSNIGWGNSGAFIRYMTATHTASTSFDGFSLNPSPSSISGTIYVYGFEE